MIRSEYKNCEIAVHRQYHPQYPPWVGLIKCHSDKLYLWNVEDDTAQQTLQKCKDFIDNNPLLE